MSDPTWPFCSWKPFGRQNTLSIDIRPNTSVTQANPSRTEISLNLSEFDSANPTSARFGTNISLNIKALLADSFHTINSGPITGSGTINLLHCMYKSTKLSIHSPYRKRTMAGWKNAVSMREQCFQKTEAQTRQARKARTDTITRT